MTPARKSIDGQTGRVGLDCIDFDQCRPTERGLASAVGARHSSALTKRRKPRVEWVNAIFDYPEVFHNRQRGHCRWAAHSVTVRAVTSIRPIHGLKLIRVTLAALGHHLGTDSYYLGSSCWSWQERNQGPGHPWLYSADRPDRGFGRSLGGGAEIVGQVVRCFKVGGA